jgi:hypothetical protein
MPRADNRLNGARNLNVLGGAIVRQEDKFKPKDIETLYRFRLTSGSRWDATLSGLAKKANADVELYRFKTSTEQVLGTIGDDDFRALSSASRDANLQLLATSKRRGNRNEKLAIDNLDAGEYVVRVFRKTGQSRYSLQMAATAIVPPLPEARGSVPTAELSAASLSAAGGSGYEFTVIYSDNNAINVASLDSGDVQVTGPNGYSQLATLVSVNDPSNGTPRIATYRIVAPGGTWDSADSGTYSVSVQSNQVSDGEGNFVGATSLGNFLANIPLLNRPLEASGSSNGSIQGYSLTVELNVKTKGNVFSNALQNFRFNNLLSTLGGDVVAKNVDLGSADIVSSPFNAGGESGVNYTAYFADYRGVLLDGRPFTLSANRLVFQVATTDPNAINSLLPLESFLNNLANGGIPASNFSLFANARDGNGNNLNDTLQILNPSLLTVNFNP